MHCGCKIFNNNYWFLRSIPFVFNFVGFCLAGHENEFRDPNSEAIIFVHAPSISVVLNLMVCFTIINYQAYYHHQPDEFIGLRFIIISLQGSIILILLDFFLQREGKLESLLNCKDALTRMLLDYVDLLYKLQCFTRISSPEKSRNLTRVKLR